MRSLPQAFQRFLSGYLALTPDVGGAARSFFANEGMEHTADLLAAIRGLLRDDPPDPELRERIEREGNIRLRSDARRFLLDLFSALSRESRTTDFKPYDVFVSYSSLDRELAARLAAMLRENGYAVWLDRDEILVGHSILDEVYRGIVQSRFLVVLLTRNAVRSKWVKEELTSARIEEIENARVSLLPVKCEDGVEIPPVLQGKRYADLTRSSFEEGVHELMRAMDLSRAGIITTAAPADRQESYDELRAWFESTAAETLQVGYNPEHGGYRDVAIGPPDGDTTKYPKQELSTLLAKTRVRLKGWGGAPFPYQDYPKATIQHLPDGLRIVDTHTWVYSAWNFTYLRITERLRLFQRSGLLEDGSLGQKDQIVLKNSLSVVWAIKDVCMALMFAATLLREVPSLRRLLVKHVLGGMNGRRLVVSGFARAPLVGDYISHSEIIQQEALIDRSSDLEAEALRIIGDIFWLFRWERFDAGVIRSDVRSFLNGEFPPNW